MSRFVTCNFLTEPQHAEVCVGFPSDGPIPRCQRCLMQETDPKWAACHSEKAANVEEIERQVIQWAGDRGILQHADFKAQALKAVSEMGELADALIKGDDSGVVDAIGDVMVCLTNLCAMKGVSLIECYLTAWNAIKDRKGTMSQHGAFVKEEEVQL